MFLVGGGLALVGGWVAFETIEDSGRVSVESEPVEVVRSNRKNAILGLQTDDLVEIDVRVPAALWPTNRALVGRDGTLVEGDIGAAFKLVRQKKDERVVPVTVSGVEEEYNR